MYSLNMVTSKENKTCFPLFDKDKDNKLKWKFASVAHWVTNLLTSQAIGCQVPVITEREKLTKFLVDDPILWHEFRKMLLEAKVVTNFGVDQMLNKFMLERRDQIEKRFNEVEKSKLRSE